MGKHHASSERRLQNHRQHSPQWRRCASRPAHHRGGGAHPACCRPHRWPRRPPSAPRCPASAGGWSAPQILRRNGAVAPPPKVGWQPGSVRQAGGHTTARWIWPAPGGRSARGVTGQAGTPRPPPPVPELRACLDLAQNWAKTKWPFQP